MGSIENYKFVVGRGGRSLEAIMPGQILVEAVVLAMRDVYPDLPPEREQWLRSHVAEFMIKDDETPRHPVMWFTEEDNTISTSLTISRLSGSVPPLQLPPQLERPQVARPAEWEGLIHRQMYRYIRGQIEAGIYAVGDKLPGPEHLEWHFGTTSNHGRHAYAQLITEGLVAGQGDGPYVVAATTPPPVQTVEGAVDRLDALEASVHETLVALRRLRGELAGVQTPRCGQWWLVRSLAQGADPITDTSYAVVIRDSESGDLQWLVTVSNTWVKKPLHYLQPLRRLTYINDWTSDDNQETPPTGAPATAAVAPGAAYYATDEQHDATASFKNYGPEQWTEGHFKED